MLVLGGWADIGTHHIARADLTWEWWAMLGLECPTSTSLIPSVTVLRQDLLLGFFWCLCALEVLVFNSPFYFGCGLRKEKQEQSPFTEQRLGSASPLFGPSQQTSLHYN